jgi:hypothetical protein
MLHNIHALYGVRLGALDGEFGHVKDFYVDDQNWAVRYLIVDTGSWLTGRQVLISPHAFGGLDSSEKILCVKLTKQQIEDSPLIETHMPVSRQFEENYYRHYGLPYYWQGDGLWGMTPLPIIMMPPANNEEQPALPDSLPEDSDPHLRSTRELHGYHLHATDGSIGHLTDFLVDDHSWAIRQLVVKTGSWFAGKEVLIPTSSVRQIVYPEQMVYLDLTQAAIKASPLHPHSQAHR